MLSTAHDLFRRHRALLGDEMLVFWVTNQEARHGAWDVPGLDPDLTLGIAERLGAAAAGR